MRDKQGVSSHLCDKMIRHIYRIALRISKFEFLPSIGASGGILTAWNDSIFSGQIFHQNAFSLSIKFTCELNGSVWIWTNVYGPCIPEDRITFLDWFRTTKLMIR